MERYKLTTIFIKMNQIDCELAILKNRVEIDTHTITELQTTVATNLDRIRELEALRSSFIKAFPLTCQDAGAGAGGGAGAGPLTKGFKLGGNPHANKTMQGGGNPLRTNPPPPVPEPVVDPAPVVRVLRIQVNGKTYLKSSDNVLYDPETKTEVGIWDPETKTMKDLQEDDDDEDEEEETKAVCCSEGQQRQPKKPRTNANRKLLSQYFKHGLSFRASKKHTKNDEIITVDIVYNSRTQTFFDRTTRVEYKSLGRATEHFSRERDANHIGNAWHEFKALNLKTGKKRSIEKLHEYNWLEVEDLEPYIDHDFMF